LPHRLIKPQTQWLKKRGSERYKKYKIKREKTEEREKDREKKREKN
jgi:hypothetical protein